MDVSNDLVAEEAVNALDALSDDGRAQMSHMERLGHIGAAIVEHNGLGRSLRLHAEGRRGGHTRHIVPQNRRAHRQVEEAGLYRLHLCEHRFPLELLSHSFRQLQRRTVRLLGCRHGAIALIFAQIRAIGERNFPQTSLQPRLFKGLGHAPRNEVDEFFHLEHPFPL